MDFIILQIGSVILTIIGFISWKNQKRCEELSKISIEIATNILSFIDFVENDGIYHSLYIKSNNPDQYMKDSFDRIWYGEIFLELRRNLNKSIILSNIYFNKVIASKINSVIDKIKKFQIEIKVSQEQYINAILAKDKYHKDFYYYKAFPLENSPSFLKFIEYKEEINNLLSKFIVTRN